MRRLLSTIIFSSLFFSASPAFDSTSRAESVSIAPERGIAALDQALRDVMNQFTVVSLAVRPGKEDAATAAYYRKKFGARVVNVFATRGEGREGAERREELSAAAHTRQALQAARIVGADVYFLDLPDFGPCKSGDEAIATWGRQELATLLLEAIQFLRPDVLITDCAPNSADGQEQAIARLLGDASAAANSTGAAETRWQVRRIFQRSEPLGDVILNIGERDHLRGLSYGEIGDLALSVYGSHKQNKQKQEATAKIHYRLVLDNSKEPLPHGVSVIEGLLLPEKVLRAILPPRVADLSLTEAILNRASLTEALIDKLVEKRAEGSKQDLQARYGADHVRIVRFIESIEQAIALLTGLDLRISLTDPLVVRGQKVGLRLDLHNLGERALPVIFHTPESIFAVEQTKYSQSEVLTLSPGSVVAKELTYDTPVEAALTVPLAARVYHAKYYQVGAAPTSILADHPFGHRLFAFAEVELDRVTIPVPALAIVDVAREIDLSITPDFALVRSWDNPREAVFELTLTNHAPGAGAASVWVVPLAVSEDNYEPVNVEFVREEESITVDLNLKVPILKPPLGPDILVEVRRPKPAPAVPLDSLKIAISTADLTLSEELAVGYVPGPDKVLEAALHQLSVKSEKLGVADIRQGSLSRLDAVLVDRLAYSRFPELVHYTARLYDYAKAGGVLVIFHQQPEVWNQIDSGPLAVKMTSRSVTQEAAPVKIIKPEHPLLTEPNRISDSDFDRWVRHRAVYLPQEWADVFEPLLESGDSGEQPTRGLLLVARHGDGAVVYASISLAEQLRARNSGAHRLLANLVSLKRTLRNHASK